MACHFLEWFTPTPASDRYDQFEMWKLLALKQIECVETTASAIGWILQIRFGIQMLESFSGLNKATSPGDQYVGITHVDVAILSDSVGKEN